MGPCCRRKGNNSVDNDEIWKVLEQEYDSIFPLRGLIWEYSAGWIGGRVRLGINKPAKRLV